jgi:hypothetical protein
MREIHESLPVNIVRIARRPALHRLKLVPQACKPMTAVVGQVSDLPSSGPNDIRHTLPDWFDVLGSPLN